MTERFDGVTGPPVAFITGASRGIGAETAKGLGHRGWSVVLGYNDKIKKVTPVVEEINSIRGDGELIDGPVARALQGDITTPEGRLGIVNDIGEYSEDELDALVLNAAGGLEKGKDANYPNVINNISQVALAEGFAPIMTPNGSMIYITSHWAHLYGEVKLPPFDYEPVASTKHAGEESLRKMIPDLTEREIRLIIVTGGLVTGTFVGDIGVRRFEDFAAEQQEIGNVVTAEEMGERIAAVAANPDLPSGHVEVVGADLDTFREQSGLAA